MLSTHFKYCIPNVTLLKLGRIFPRIHKVYSFGIWHACNRVFFAFAEFFCSHQFIVNIFIILLRVWVTKTGFGLLTWFIDHLYPHLITTSKYNSLTGLHTLKITVTAAHKVSYVFTSRFLVTDPNNVLCLRSCRVANVSPLTQLWTSSSLQPFGMDNLKNTTHCCIHCCLRSHRRGPYRKHRFLANALARWSLPSCGCCLVCFAVIT
jgi:hypothetical protein